MTRGPESCTEDIKLLFPEGSIYRPINQSEAVAGATPTESSRGLHGTSCRKGGREELTRVREGGCEIRKNENQRQ